MPYMQAHDPRGLSDVPPHGAGGGRAHGGGSACRMIRVPTLIVAGEKDTFTPAHLAADDAEGDPGSGAPDGGGRVARRTDRAAQARLGAHRPVPEGAGRAREDFGWRSPASSCAHARSATPEEGGDDGASHTPESAPSSISDPNRDSPMRPTYAPTARPIAEADASPDLAVFQTRAPVWGKSIGHTSVVFKLKLEGGAQAAYKPRSQARPGSLQRGDRRVPPRSSARALERAPRVARGFVVDGALAALGGEATRRGQAPRGGDDRRRQGNVPGAIIPWIDRPHVRSARRGAGTRSAWRGWLAPKAERPGGQEEARRADQHDDRLRLPDRQLGPLERRQRRHRSERGRRCLFIDNDGAFFDPPPPGPLALQLGLLEGRRAILAELRRRAARARPGRGARGDG